MAEPREVKIGHEREYLLLRDGERSSRGELWSVHAQLSLSSLSADAQVWIGHPKEQPLNAFFAALADERKGWEGFKEWRTYEAGLELSAANDGRGHISLGVQLSPRSVGGWLVSGYVPLDAGQLAQLAHELEIFWTP